jgi:hypothetical protein
MSYLVRYIALVNMLLLVLENVSLDARAHFTNAVTPRSCIAIHLQSLTCAGCNASIMSCTPYRRIGGLLCVAIAVKLMLGPLVACLVPMLHRVSLCLRPNQHFRLTVKLGLV